MRIWIVIFVVFAWARPGEMTAYANPVQLATKGECPRDWQMREAMRNLGLFAQQAEDTITISVQTTATGAELRIDAGGQTVLTRQVASGDCAAIAEVFALIARDSLAAIATPPPVTETVQASAPEPSGEYNNAFGLIAGIAATTKHTVQPGFAQLDGSLEFYGVRIGGSLWLAGTEEFDSKITRQFYGARMTFGREFPLGTMWIRPQFGAGLVATHIRVPEQLRLWRLHPVLSSTLAVGIPLSNALSLRIDGRFLLFPIVDEYSSASSMFTEKASRRMLALGAGLEWRIH